MTADQAAKASGASDRDERRELALNEARTILEHEGIGGLSMRRLAKASKMAVNTLYAMFSTREGVLEALVDEAVALRLESLGNLDAAGATPVDQLDTIVTRAVADAVARARVYKPMYRAAGELRRLRERAGRIGTAFFEERLRNAVEAGQLRDDVALGPLAGLLREVINEASLAWAHDEIDAELLEARCRYTLAVVLVAAAHPAWTQQLQQRLKQAGAQLVALEARRAGTRTDQAS